MVEMVQLRYKKKMAFVTELEQIVRSYDGCGFVPVGNMDIYQRTIEVRDLRADFSQCWDEYRDTVFEELLNLAWNNTAYHFQILRDEDANVQAFSCCSEIIYTEKSIRM